MPLPKVQKELAERLAELLAQSTIGDELKDLILEKIDKLPEHLVFKLLDALETENDQLEEVVSKIESYLADQENGWEEVEENQLSFAEKYLEDMAQKLDDEARILELKESI